jgi:hypothetical protein
MANAPLSGERGVNALFEPNSPMSVLAILLSDDDEGGLTDMCLMKEIFEKTRKMVV